MATAPLPCALPVKLIVKSWIAPGASVVLVTVPAAKAQVPVIPPLQPEMLTVTGAFTTPVFVTRKLADPDWPTVRDWDPVSAATEACGAGGGTLMACAGEPNVPPMLVLFTVSVTVPDPPVVTAWNDTLTVSEAPTASVCDAASAEHGLLWIPPPVQLVAKLTGAGTVPVFVTVNGVLAACPALTCCVPPGAVADTCGAAVTVTDAFFVASVVLPLYPASVMLPVPAELPT